MVKADWNKPTNDSTPGFFCRQSVDFLVHHMAAPKTCLTQKTSLQRNKKDLAAEEADDHGAPALPKVEGPGQDGVQAVNILHLIMLTKSQAEKIDTQLDDLVH
jgi:hypothetical protein